MCMPKGYKLKPNDIIIECDIVKIIINSHKYGKKYVLVDKESYNKISKYRIFIHKIGNVFYPQLRINGKLYYLHKFITGNKLTYHINNNILDNRLCNLKECISHQNNISIQSNNTSGYKGVSYLKRYKKWSAKIKFKNKVKYLGVYNTKEEAAISYNKKALELYGEFAYLNVIKENK